MQTTEKKINNRVSIEVERDSFSLIHQLDRNTEMLERKMFTLYERRNFPTRNSNRDDQLDDAESERISGSV